MSFACRVVVVVVRKVRNDHGTWGIYIQDFPSVHEEAS